eukprot:1157898-Pelagomonas_calceolata.AAC.16
MPHSVPVFIVLASFDDRLTERVNVMIRAWRACCLELAIFAGCLAPGNWLTVTACHRPHACGLLTSPVAVSHTGCRLFRALCQPATLITHTVPCTRLQHVGHSVSLLHSSPTGCLALGTWGDTLLEAAPVDQIQATCMWGTVSACYSRHSQGALHKVLGALVDALLKAVPVVLEDLDELPADGLALGLRVAHAFQLAQHDLRAHLQTQAVFVHCWYTYRQAGMLTAGARGCWPALDFEPGVHNVVHADACCNAGLQRLDMSCHIVHAEAD